MSIARPGAWGLWLDVMRFEKVSESDHVGKFEKRAFADFDSIRNGESVGICGAGKSTLMRRISRLGFGVLLADASLITVSHDPGTPKQHCTCSMVVYGGTKMFVETVDEATDMHYRLQRRAA